MEDTKISKTATNTELEIHSKSSVLFSNRPSEPNEDSILALQIAVGDWEAENFGQQPWRTSALGLIEELKELLVAVGAADMDEVVDAIGDIFVFSLNLCTKQSLDFSVIFESSMSNMQPLSGMDVWVKSWCAAGDLACVMLKSEQGIRGYDDTETVQRDVCIALTRLVDCVHSLAFGNDLPAELIMFEVANKVMKRDWKKNTYDGDVAAS